SFQTFKIGALGPSFLETDDFGISPIVAYQRYRRQKLLSTTFFRGMNIFKNSIILFKYTAIAYVSKAKW
ncbi:hypothetical protein, partial [Salmonella enterica]|uniref:hypothetical protein n=1 Tax=Salmonella enterica TaxID=28901 RepID=UPI003CEDD60B